MPAKGRVKKSSSRSGPGPKVLLDLLERYYADAQCALHYENSDQLLMATILSAQCTDARVNQVTPELFRRYPTFSALARASVAEIESLIRPTGFFKNKARHLLGCAHIIQDQFGGSLPATMEKLIQLPGVGRKTANVLLGNAFGITSGIVVDTHVLRLSRRLGLTQSKSPEVVEQDLMKVIPKAKWVAFSHELILHGRQVCKARKPRCDTCFLERLCPKIIS